jgi:hypothetical protein
VSRVTRAGKRRKPCAFRTPASPASPRHELRPGTHRTETGPAPGAPEDGAGSFFDLGGHSLLIMRLLADVKATLDLEISICTVFSMPTLVAVSNPVAGA